MLGPLVRVEMLPKDSWVQGFGYQDSAQREYMEAISLVTMKWYEGMATAM